MQKIPVGQTIAFAYRFLFAEIGIIVGIAWIPAILSSFESYLVRIYASMNRAELEAGDRAAAGAYFLVSLGSLLVTIFASSMVAVAITRQILGPRKSGVIAYFAIGKTEWRMFNANMRYLLGIATLIVLAAAITTLAFLLSGIPLDAPEQIRPTLASLLAGLISWAVFIYAFVAIVRMGFLLPATIVGEAKGGLRRSHELTRGNVWRVLLIALALGLPILLLVLGGEAVVLRSALGPGFMRLNPTEFIQRAGRAMDDKALPWGIFSMVVFILGSGLIYSGAAFAYRAIIGGPEPPRPPA
jgi:hypothetical protein